MMTRQRMYMLTAFSALLFIVMNWAFADNMFNLGNLFSMNIDGSSFVTNMTIFTYLFLALIIVAGVWQARRLPEAGVNIEPAPFAQTEGQADDPKTWKLMLGNVYFGVVWLALRFFIGFEWLAAGEHKIRDSAWMDGGAALKGFWTRATTVPEGAANSPAGNYGWFNDLLTYMLNNEWYTWFAKLIAIGEFLIGIGLIVGALVGIAAFFGTLLNFNFMLAGTVSSNPVMFAITVFLVLGWKVAGYFGVDRYLLPTLGAPWQAGSLVQGEGVTAMRANGDRGPVAHA
ncbi:MAG: hypothetical protein M9890_07145 [Thermomicrobiales bacterium]|nr:hypothetical protein [Thermomicrobiales bacterium]